MTALAICAVVFAGSLFVSWRLAQFLRAMDNLDAQREVIEEAERIVNEASRS